MSYEILDRLDGKPIYNPLTRQHLTMHLKSKEQLLVELEIAINHPLLQAELEEVLKNENYDYDIFFGACFAYCGILLDSTNSAYGYAVKELYEQLARALVNKREAIAVSINTMPSPEGLINTMVEMKEANEAASKELIIPPSSTD